MISKYKFLYQIVTWLYTNDNNFDSKEQWRMAFINFLDGLIDENLK